ncbi:hypothetical protein PtA15_18A202 [Puccinia triticina]|uniref:Uncharacterized protein n=1 Tax=Puccinia triticina TaxID=208348 RepID=A0ABY7D8N6_9BASI|nr:uncharacterized protein PtA15_18A202 [Puccinia triticina]WAQ93144.1 hypothetical protein PtA15_18A202 [Puccinia triticina]
MDDASVELKDIEIHVLEEHYKKMKIEYKSKQAKLISKINQGQGLTNHPMRKKRGLMAMLDSEEIRTMRKICEFEPPAEPKSSKQDGKKNSSIESNKKDAKKKTVKQERQTRWKKTSQ